MVLTSQGGGGGGVLRCLIWGFFWAGKFWQVFNWVFKTIWKFVIVPVYPGCIVPGTPNMFCDCFYDHQMQKRFLLQMVWWINKHKHSITKLCFHFPCYINNINAFWKFLWLGNSAWGFLGVKFWSRDFLGFDFCLHSIILVTWNPEYPHMIEVWQHRAVL